MAGKEPELMAGKEPELMAGKEPELMAGKEPERRHDSSTNALIRRYRAPRRAAGD
jgi:hypothetical protein